MTKILTPPRPSRPRTRKCSCGCRFEYTSEDVRSLPPPDGDTIVVCPGCSEWISIESRTDYSPLDR